MIKFLFKMIIVFIVALAAVIYHNTEAGRDMEKRIGREMSMERLSERAGELLDRTIYFLSLKGLEYKAKSEEALKESLKAESSGGKRNTPVPSGETGEGGPERASAAKAEAVKGPLKKDRVSRPSTVKEDIPHEDRQRLLDIIGSE